MQAGADDKQRDESQVGSSNPPIASGQDKRVAAENKSIWARAKESLSEVSTQATFAGVTTASKAAQLGKQSRDAAGDTARNIVDVSKQLYSGSKLESAIQYVDAELDQRGAKQAIKSTTGAVVDKLDQVTGKRLLELLEEKLRIQDAYNDILATRLAEALERIAKLEARIDDDNVH